MARLRRCRRGPLFVILVVASLVYIYSWVFSGIMEEGQDREREEIYADSAMQEMRIQRGDFVTRKPDPTKPPVYFRHQEVKARCGPRPSTPRAFRFSMDPLIVRNPDVFFCPLAKAGSTFFTRYFMALRKDGSRMENPYLINVKDASRRKQPTFNKSLRTFKEQAAFLNQSIKVVFTRNPYSRIFSAYVDKLFSPNPYYWKHWGEMSVNLNKLDPNKHPCGSQVSFKDFIKSVIYALWKKDMHFIPMNAMCKFCEVEYDLVGRVEDSITDLEFLSNKLNVSSSFLYDKDYKSSAVDDAIKDSTEDAISTWKDEITSCISAHDSGLIVWRKLQLRGLIDAKIAFPFNQAEMESVDLEGFRTECYKAMNKSTDAVRLKRQKVVAYQHAYSTLPQSDVGKLQQIYKRDFVLLGYDNARPDASISGAGVLEDVTTDPLNWRIEWELT